MIQKGGDLVVQGLVMIYSSCAIAFMLIYVISKREPFRHKFVRSGSGKRVQFVEKAEVLVFDNAGVVDLKMQAVSC